MFLFQGLLTSWFKTPDGGSTPEPGKTVLPYMKPLSPEGVNNNLVSSGSGSAGFAKKRWLRQAISEDHCDSPNSRTGSGDAVECVTPLKKRRLARESMSAEQDSQLADSPANQESESDQPTQDEDKVAQAYELFNLSPPRKTDMIEDKDYRANKLQDIDQDG